MKPKAETVKFIFANDRDFATDVATNNRTCQRAPACRK